MQIKNLNIQRLSEEVCTRAPKKYCRGTHRFCTPEETWEKIRFENTRIGLTRNADITGLDYLNIPVTLAIRPNAITLSVSSGKGLTKQAALVSGFMEALELYQAENYFLETTFASRKQLFGKMPIVNYQELCLKKEYLLPENWPISWCYGLDLMHHREVALPLQAVSLGNDPHLQGPWPDLNAFDRTSNGLASGNHILEAICSAIYEVIERDAITCHELIAKDYTPPELIKDSIPYESVRAIYTQCEQKDVMLRVYDCSVDTNVPTFKAYLHDRKVRSTGICLGYGSHLDPEVAMLRAITEAIQSRVVYISGARDDIFWSDFYLFKKFDSPEVIQSFDAKDCVDAGLYVNQASMSFEEDLKILLEKLSNADISEVIVVKLSDEKDPFSVVKVVIPKMEGYLTRHYLPKRRARKWAEKKLGKVHFDDSTLKHHRMAGGNV